MAIIPASTGSSVLERNFGALVLSIGRIIVRLARRCFGLGFLLTIFREFTMSSDINHEPLQFAYWVPNVSGGLVTSKIEQRTDWSYDYNQKLAVLAENHGFDYALSQVRYVASYFQQESTSFSVALLLATQRLKVIAAVHPGLRHPAVLAKLIATADHLSGGRAAVNVVSGWFKGEFTALGEPWLEHDERYRRSEEFVRVLRASWTEEDAQFQGDFYRLHGYDLKPKPVEVRGRAHPEIFQGGNSTAARAMAGRVSDWYFSNGKDFDGITEQIKEVNSSASAHGRTVRFGLNGFLIARDTETEARETLRGIVAKADVEAVARFRDAVRQAGQSTSDKRGMWADSSFDDLVQYNDGFRTKLIGTPEQIAHRMIEYKKRGVNLLLLGFLHYHEEVEYFGRRVLPIMRELEADLHSRSPIAQTRRVLSAS
jgi:dimethylsulfone monooxygenase